MYVASTVLLAVSNSPVIVELIAGAKNNEDRTVPIMTDIGALEKAVEDVLGMLDRVSGYVDRVIVRHSPLCMSSGLLTILTEGRVTGVYCHWKIPHEYCYPRTQG
jgi:hypothetical protein